MRRSSSPSCPRRRLHDTPDIALAIGKDVDELLAIKAQGHCAPQLSVHGLAAVPRLRHLEYFHDHVRVESMLFDGVLEPDGGALTPDRSRTGNGLSVKREEAGRWAL